MHDLKQHHAACPLIRRLGEIGMSESERRTAIEYMRRGERIADCIVALARIFDAIGTATARGAARLSRALAMR